MEENLKSCDDLDLVVPYMSRYFTTLSSNFMILRHTKIQYGNCYNDAGQVKVRTTSFRIS